MRSVNNPVTDYAWAQVEEVLMCKFKVGSYFTYNYLVSEFTADCATYNIFFCCLPKTETAEEKWHGKVALCM